MPFLPMEIRFDSESDRSALFSQVKAELRTLRIPLRLKLGKVMVSILENPTYFPAGSIVIDPKSQICCTAEVNLTAEQLKVIQDLVTLREELESPYSAIPEVMMFFVKHHEHADLLRPVDTIVYQTQRLKGKFEISERELVVDVDLKEIL